MTDQYDRVLLRLSSTDDESLAGPLAKLLPMVFDELLSGVDGQGRAKVINVLNHVLTRAKGNSAIKLPALSIAERWFSTVLPQSGNAPFFRNLSLIFLDLGVPRLSAAEKIDFAFYTFSHFGQLQPGADRVALFLLSIAGLGEAAGEGVRTEQVSRVASFVKENWTSDEQNAAAKGLSAFFHTAREFLLIPCGSTEAPSVGGLASSSWASWKARLKAKSVNDMMYLKTAVLRWLGSLAADVPPALVYLPSLVATVENYESVSNMAESNCRRLDPELDLEGDEALLGRLVCAALTSPPPGHEAAEGVLQVEAKANVPAKLRLKVVLVMQRAKGIGSQRLVPYAVHLIRQCLRESEQVQIAALQFAMALAEKIQPECLTFAGDAILKEVEAIFWPGGGVLSAGAATPLAFRVFGAFTRQIAEQASGDGRALALQAAPRILALLDANPSSAHDILEALSGLVACMNGATASERQDFVPLLDRLVLSPKPVVRREVLRWATTLFPATAPEGRYYALRLFGDEDANICRAAETALSSSSSGREAPPFASMCAFLAARALGEGAAGVELLTSHAEAFSVKPPNLAPLRSSFATRDLARALSFLLTLAESEGLHQALEGPAGSMAPAAKKARLEVPQEKQQPTSLSAVMIQFLSLLDYLLAEAICGDARAIEEAVVDGMSMIELAVRGLLLSAELATGEEDLLQAILHRTEVVVLGSAVGGSNAVLLREGGAKAGQLRRLGSRVLGKLCEQLAGKPQDPTERWLTSLGEALHEGQADAKRAGAVLTVCELLRARPTVPRARPLCEQAIALLRTPKGCDAALLTAACDGLRRLSERQRLVLDIIEEASQQSAFFDAVYDLSKPVTAGLGDIKTPELSTSARDLAQSSWRLLGQLAAWGGPGSEECIQRLIAIGRHTPGEEALTALGLAIVSASLDPASTASSSQRADALLLRLLEMASPAAEQAEAEGQDGSKADEDAPKMTPAEKQAEQRCGMIWLAVLLRTLHARGISANALPEQLERVCRVFVRFVGEVSLFTADVGQKALVFLYCLAPAESRASLLKTMFSSMSNRTMVTNMFVGTANTATNREAKEKEVKAGQDSLKITAKERMDMLKDMIFLARELQHPPAFIAMLDQPSSSAWTSEVFREAIDLQSPCLPEELAAQVFPVSLRPKLFPHFFHPNALVRQAVVAVTAFHLSCETPQQLILKFPQDWPSAARYDLVCLESGRLTTREAAIQAANLLFAGKIWPELKDIFVDFWTIVIRLMDDMEPQIQTAVRPLVRLTRNLTLRLCDRKTSKPSDTAEALRVILPMLLKFLEHHKHATAVCFDVLREIVKLAQGSDLLADYVQDLIPPLLVSLSMMEHSSLAYYQLHVDAKDEKKGQELESARITASRDSDSMKLLRQMVPLITMENAELLAPKSRELLHRGVGANTRVGVCDLWAMICAERAHVIPVGGPVAVSMLRSVAGALLDPSSQVRSAAASCFASFVRRNSPAELTKIVMERLIRQDEEHRTDDDQRNSFRVALARALAEVFRRCDDSVIEPELKVVIAAKAFGLRYAEDQDVRNGWEPLWSDLCPTTSVGVDRHSGPICAELASVLAKSASRSERISMAKAVSALCAQLEKKTPRPKWAEEPSISQLHNVMRETLQSLPVFDGIGVIVRALADLAALIHRRERNEDGCATDGAGMGLPLVKSFCSKGSLADRGAAVRAVSEMVASARLWGPLSDLAELHKAASTRVDELQEELLAEERAPGVAAPVVHRGKAQSAAEELLTATMDFWTATLEQCRREVEDEGDLDPAEEADFAAYLQATLDEFASGSLTLRLAIVRDWKKVFGHFAEERLPVSGRATPEIWAGVASALQDATMDQRSERLRKPALELSASLAKDVAKGGGREVFRLGLGKAVEKSADASAAQKVFDLDAWLTKLDPLLVEQCGNWVADLRQLKE
mmetsp:Transcript_67517/g.162040  ORF Transcript_67517/g.162040 Transcript_67517/m.162040 type:complete len:1938 (+) Transcript_67517:91-5904(+)